MYCWNITECDIKLHHFKLHHFVTVLLYQYYRIALHTACSYWVEVAGWKVREILVLFPQYLTVCGKKVKDVFGHPGARILVGSARIRTQAAHDLGAWQQV